jgi:hypothetical protein
MKTLGKGSIALHREVPGCGGGLQAVRDEGRDLKTQGATKEESTPRGVPSKPTTLSPRRHLILTPRFGPSRNNYVALHSVRTLANYCSCQEWGTGEANWHHSLASGKSIETERPGSGCNWDLGCDWTIELVWFGRSCSFELLETIWKRSFWWKRALQMIRACSRRNEHV